MSTYQYVSYRISVQEELYLKGFLDTVFDTDITGVIVSFPEYGYQNNQYVVLLDNVLTYIQITTQPFQKFSYLDKVSFSGKIGDVRDDPVYFQYYKDKNINYKTLYPNIYQISNKTPETIFEKIKIRTFNLKIFLQNHIQKTYSSQTSSLILGMLIGEKSELSKDEKALFNKVGLSHILVVSGYNISILISFVFLLSKYFSRYVKTFLSLVILILFTVLVGGDPSVIRAVCMGSILIFAKIFRRPSGTINILYIVATSMLLYNPSDITNISLHLSFLATYSLLIMPSIKKIPEYIMSIVWVTCFLGVYICFLSDSFSFIGIITNLFVLGIVPVFMGVAFGSIILSILKIFIGIDFLILEIMRIYIFFIAQVASRVPVFIYKIAPQVVVLFYGMVCSIFIFQMNRYVDREFIQTHYQKFVPQKPS